MFSSEELKHLLGAEHGFLLFYQACFSKISYKECGIGNSELLQELTVHRQDFSFDSEQSELFEKYHRLLHQLFLNQSNLLPIVLTYLYLGNPCFFWSLLLDGRFNLMDFFVDYIFHYSDDGTKVPSLILYEWMSYVTFQHYVLKRFSTKELVSQFNRITSPVIIFSLLKGAPHLILELDKTQFIGALCSALEFNSLNCILEHLDDYKRVLVDAIHFFIIT